MRTTSVNPVIGRKDIDELVKLYDTGRPTYHTDLIRKTRTSSMLDYRYQQLGELGTMALVNEGNPIPDKDIFIGFPRTVTAYKRGVGFSASTETFESDQWNIFGNMIPLMKDSEERTLEYIAAQMHNNATSTGAAYLMGDSVALASASHVIQGGTTSNLVAAALGYGALEDAIEALLLTPSHTGDPDPIAGPFDLLVHPSQLTYAERLLGAPNYPGTNTQDPNQTKGRIRRVHANPYFTSTTAWALKVVGTRDPFEWLWRRMPRSRQQEDVHNDNVAFRRTMIVTAFAKQWRGYYYSTGLG